MDKVQQILEKYNSMTLATVGNNGVQYNPEDLTINVGDTVTWTNNDGGGHTATSTSGPESFDSGNIASGGTWSFTFTKAGTYDYKCDYHSSMTATITVND